MRMHGHVGGQYRALSDADLDRVLDGALTVLERCGVLVATRTGREALKKQGAAVDEDTAIVRMPRSLIEDAIASAPSSLALRGRNPGHDCLLEGSRVHLGTGGTALYVLDLDTGQRRRSLTQDICDCARLGDALENNHIFTINVYPNEIQNTDQVDINRFYWSLQNTTKHVMGGVYSLAGTREVLEMAQMVAGSPEALRERPLISIISLVISPLKIDDTYGEIACYVAEQGLPIVVPAEPICGTTAPVTLAGNVLMHVADTLAGLTMVQSVRPGAPTVCGSVGSTIDLRTMQHLGGPIERAMLNAAVSQVAQHLELPYYSTAGPSDAKVPDAQAAYESALGNLLVMMSGANYIHDALGLTEFDLTVSYEKMVMDDEIIGMAGRVLRGIEVNDDTLAVDLVCDRGPGSHFVAEEHTVKYMRDEFYEPKLSDRREREHWESAGGPDATTLARQQAREILDSHEPPGLPAEIDAAIRARFPHIVEPKEADAPEPTTLAHATS
jgi:trimethylamine--corrinoid protein Co-methyltransferase